MLFEEFINGTGCRNTDKNYAIYRELELIYMNTDCTKEHIYEYGKKLVDNSKTEAELALEKSLKESMDYWKDSKKEAKSRLKVVLFNRDLYKDNKEERARLTAEILEIRAEISKYDYEIVICKSRLESI